VLNARVVRRLLEIQRVLVRHGLEEFVRATHLYRPLLILDFLQPSTWFARARGGTRGERLRLALEELGPLFVKFGQALSTRPDLLPSDIAGELAKLQDQVPPFPGPVARAAIERSLGKPVGELFASFDEQALAAASIAQVHAATLKDGREVVVKVLRPGMAQLIRRDLEVLYALAGLANRYWAEGRRLRPLDVVKEYDRTVMNELDLMREAANAALLKRNFSGSDLLYVPEVHWDYCRPDVLVMERIRGIPINDRAQLDARRVNIQRLAENGVQIFFTQMLRDNFFHADMHPGNIFIDAKDPAHPKYAAVDFGICGTLDPRDQQYLAANFLAFFDRDYRRVAELHVESGWLPAGTRVDEFESAVRTVCEPIFEKPLKDISFGIVLLHLFETARQFRMEVQPQLVLLQKTLLNIEGLGRELYPELDLWKTAQPLLRRWAQERSSPRAVIAALRRHAPDLAEAVRALPLVAERLIQRGMRPAAPPASIESAIEAMREELRVAARRAERTLFACTLLATGLVCLALPSAPRWLGPVLLASAVLLFVLRD